MEVEAQLGGRTGWQLLPDRKSQVFPGVVGMRRREGWKENRGTRNHTPQGTEEPLGRRAGRGQQLGGEAWRVASAAGVGCSRKFSLRAWGASITPPRGHAPFALRGRAGRRVPRAARDPGVGRRGTAGNGGARGSAGPELGHLFTETVRPLGS